MPTFYKKWGDGTIEDINVTPEQAQSHVGGTVTDPYAGLVKEGWSLTKPGTTEPDTTQNNDQTVVDPNLNAINNTVNSDYQNLVNLQNQAGVLTAEEEAAIEKQAQEEGLKYDILLKEAAEKKRQGVATGTVAVGQRGGFESSQLAGAAALAPTVGGTWAGQGGALEKVVSAYDLNIQNLEVQKQQAINTARDALREAKLTGKSEKFKIAKEMYELAKKSQTDAVDMAYKKAQLLKANQDYFKATTEYAADNVANTLIDSLTGNTEQDNALLQSAADQAGITIGDVKSSLRKIYDEQSFYSSSALESLAKTIPSGETRTIKDPNTGRIYTVTGQPDTYQVTSDDGTVRTMDKLTNKEISKSAPGVGKTKTQASSITINAVGQRTPFYVSGKQAGYQTYNDKTGKVQVFDMNGNPLTALPEGAQLGTYSAGNPTEQDSLLSEIEATFK